MAKVERNQFIRRWALESGPVTVNRSEAIRERAENMVEADARLGVELRVPPHQFDAAAQGRVSRSLASLAAAARDSIRDRSIN